MGLSTRATVALDMDAEGYVRGARKARDATDRLEGKVRSTGGTSKKATGSIGKLTGGFASLAGPVALGATALTGAAVAAGRVVSGFIRAGAEAEEVASKFGMVFRDQTEEMQAFVDSWGQLAGIDDTALQNTLANFGVMGQAIGIADDHLGTFSEGLVRAAGDWASFNDKSVVEVSEAITSALQGMTRPLKSLGAEISAAEISQRALTDSGKESVKELTKSEKAYATYNLILESLGAAQNNLELTQDSTANSLKRLGAAVGNIHSDFSELVVAAVAPLIKGISALAVKWVPRIRSALQGLRGVIKGGVTNSLSGDMKGLATYFGTVLKVGAELARLVGGTVVRVFKLLWDRVRHVVGAVAGLVGPLANAREASGDFAGALEAVRGLVDKFLLGLDVAIDVISGFTDAAIAAASVVGRVLAGDMKGALDAAKNSAKALGDIKGKVTERIENFGKAVKDAGGELENAEEKTSALDWATQQQALSALAGSDAAAGLAGSLGAVGSSAAGAASELTDLEKQTAIELEKIKAEFDGLKEPVEGVWEALAGKRAQDALDEQDRQLTAAVNRFEQYAALMKDPTAGLPSVKAAWTDLEDKIEFDIPAATALMKTDNAEVLAAMKRGTSQFGLDFKAAWDEMSGHVPESLKTVGDSFSSLFDEKGQLDVSLDNAAGLVGSFATSIGGKMGDAIGDMAGKVEGLFGEDGTFDFNLGVAASAFASFGTAIGGTTGTILSHVGNIAAGFAAGGPIGAAIAGLPALIDLAKGPLEGVFNGIKNVVSGIGDAIAGLFGSTKDRLTEAQQEALDAHHEWLASFRAAEDDFRRTNLAAWRQHYASVKSVHSGQDPATPPDGSDGTGDEGDDGGTPVPPPPPDDEEEGLDDGSEEINTPPGGRDPVDSPATPPPESQPPPGDEPGGPGAESIVSSLTQQNVILSRILSSVRDGRLAEGVARQINDDSIIGAPGNG